MSASSAIPAIVGLTKLASTFVVSSGSGAIVKTGVNMVKPFIAQGRFPLYKKISVSLGAAALGGLAADATSKYMNAQIDDYVKIAGFAAGTVADISEKVGDSLEKNKTKLAENIAKPKGDGSSFHQPQG